MGLIKDLFVNRSLIFSLAKNDFKTKYAGSVFGIFWAFVQPVITIFVYWFVFSVGMKQTGGTEVPFVLYLIAGIIPWFFFSDGFSGGANSLLSYSYLVKKVVFNVNIIPVVKIVSAIFVHIFFVVFTLVLAVCYGYYPSLYWIQILYYSLCCFVFILGLSYIFGACVVFFRDMAQIINIILQIGIWVVPIMWNVAMIADHPTNGMILKLNPIYYIVFGYRQAIYERTWFWENGLYTIYFWCVNLLILFIGVKVFKRLKPHFSDVL